MLEKAASAGIPGYVAVAPFLPFHDREILEAVLAKVLPLHPREVFCEVLNPKGDNLAMMVIAPAFPQQAARLAAYSDESWSKFTWSVLKHGPARSRRFIPWPDTQRQWRTHLPAASVSFLDRFLPPRELVAA